MDYTKSPRKLCLYPTGFGHRSMFTNSDLVVGYGSERRCPMGTEVFSIMVAE